MSEIAQRGNADLYNWRDAEHVRWSFQNLAELVPSATIYTSPTPHNWNKANTESNNDRLIFDGPSYSSVSFGEMLAYFHTDALLVIRNGVIVLEHYANHYDQRHPHTIFSVSKSLTSVLAGLFVGKDGIDLNKAPAHYLPDLAASAYADCTIQQLLDMQIAIDFEESYLDRTGQFNRYRMAMMWVPQDPAEPQLSLRSFAATLKNLPEKHPHGELFRYRSPNSDVLGMLIEEISGQRFADVFSEQIWQPIGAADNALITLDHAGGARTGGGILTTARDLACFGELVRNHGSANGRQIVPESWIVESLNGGDPVAWSLGDFVTLAPEGRYRNKWYNTGHKQNFGIGIHGQYIYVDHECDITIAHFASHPDPLNDGRDTLMVKFLQQLSASFAM